MSSSLKPWVRTAFDLIVHAEIHLRDGEDFDRRMAHIGFDNAIEVTITTYLGLNPLQRNGKTYKKEDVASWLVNYHTKLNFLEMEARTRGWNLKVPKDEVIFYHDIRNSQYHSGGPGVPEAAHIADLRMAALDAFAMLFDIDDVEQELERSLQQRVATQDEKPGRNSTVDKLLDMAEGPVSIAGQAYFVSEALYGTDPDAYQAITAAVAESRSILTELSAKYPGCVSPSITHIGFVHYENSVYLKTINQDGDINLTDCGFISGEDIKDQFFSPAQTPEENADLLVTEFDPYSIIHCFEIFSDEAAKRIAEAYENGRLESLSQHTGDDGRAKE